jgi:hypothetical protein
LHLALPPLFFLFEGLGSLFVVVVVAATVWKSPFAAGLASRKGISRREGRKDGKGNIKNGRKEWGGITCKNARTSGYMDWRGRKESRRVRCDWRGRKEGNRRVRCDWRGQKGRM